MIDWKFWKSLPTLKLWEAVALLLQVDPEGLAKGGSSSSWNPQFDDRSFPSQAKYKEFDKTLSLAKRAANRDDGPIHVQRFQAAGSSRAVAEVRLADVVVYFSRLGAPSIPTELLEFLYPEAPAGRTSDSELTTREHGSLLKIIFGMATGGYRFDPKAKRSEVAGEIASDCAAAGCPIDEDTVRKYLRRAVEHVASPPQKPNSSGV